jgi:pyridoxal phosphate enzyme (YggS family)
VNSLGQRYSQLRSQLPANVQLLAVSKGRTAAEIRFLHGLGQRSFAESRLQEAQEKLQQLADLNDLDWHFIGKLQTNKVRGVLRLFSTVQSVDNSALAQRISRIAVEEGLSPRAYVQVQLLPDPNKGGFSLIELQQQWLDLKKLAAINWQGVMLIPPQGLGAEELTGVFREGAHLARHLQLPGCSMGMSQDWPLAVKEGSTMVRVGSSLFEPQNVTKSLQVPPRGAI